MSGLEKPRMVWLSCGHERITMRPVYAGRKLPCPVCKTDERIVTWGTVGEAAKAKRLTDGETALIHDLIESTIGDIPVEPRGGCVMDNTQPKRSWWRRLILRLGAPTDPDLGGY